ncbi:unnamed protein product [Ectocarpus sp. 12 AP-2014]
MDKREKKVVLLGLFRGLVANQSIPSNSRLGVFHKGNHDCRWQGDVGGVSNRPAGSQVACHEATTERETATVVGKTDHRTATTDNRGPDRLACHTTCLGSVSGDVDTVN